MHLNYAKDIPLGRRIAKRDIVSCEVSTGSCAACNIGGGGERGPCVGGPLKDSRCDRIGPLCPDKSGPSCCEGVGPD